MEIHDKEFGICTPSEDKPYVTYSYINTSAVNNDKNISIGSVVGHFI